MFPAFLFIFPQMPGLFCRTSGWRKAENMLWAISLRPKRREEKLSARVDDFSSWMEDTYAGRWIGHIGHVYLYHLERIKWLIRRSHSSLPLSWPLGSGSWFHRSGLPNGCNLHVSKKASWDGNLPTHRMLSMITWWWGNHSFFTLQHPCRSGKSAAVLKTTTQGIQKLQDSFKG